jgi:ATP-dependent Lon protease
MKYNLRDKRKLKNKNNSPPNPPPSPSESEDESEEENEENEENDNENEGKDKNDNKIKNKKDDKVKNNKEKDDKVKNNKEKNYEKEIKKIKKEIVDETGKIKPNKLHKCISKIFTKKPKQDESSSEEDDLLDNDETENDEDSDEEDTDDDEYDDINPEDNDNNLNIILSIKPEEEDFMEDEEMIESDEDEDCDSDDEKTFMKENYHIIETIPTSTSPTTTTPTTTTTTTTSKNKNKPIDVINDVESEYLELLDLKKNLTLKIQKNSNNKYLKNAIKECKDAIKTLIKEARTNNTKTYKSLVVGDKNKPSEIDYFKKKLSNKEQLDIMKDLKEINQFIHIEKPYRLSILQSKMPSKFKSLAIQKLNMLRSMEPGDSEFFKIKNWVDTFMKIPFNRYNELSVNMNDGVETCNLFLQNAKTTLDECVYGLDDAKLQIMQMIGQWISNPSALGSAIAIKGPAGTGKTSLVKNGISKILGREFAFIALGGAGDSSFLEGHSYTYEGSTWGKIVQILIDSKCMNPVIFFDELDKISNTSRGQEINGILTHLTDTTQNNQFHDKYFSEIDFDLSKCLFIFSYNDENLVNPILKDRMYRIETKGYDIKEKIIIAKNYLLPKIREQVNFKEEDVVIPDDTIQHIIQSMTKNEDGVRNLKRSLEIIHTKLNLFRLIKPDNNMFTKQIDINVSFPFTVSKKHADILIKTDINQNQSLLAMYV